MDHAEQDGRDAPGSAGEVSPEGLNLLGGRLCLDFVNTVDPRVGENRQDYLSSYAAYLAWGVHVGVLTGEQAQQLHQEAAERPAEAGAVVDAAVTLREALYRLFATASEGDAPAAADLSILNDALSAALARLRVVPVDDGFDWDWEEDPHALDRVLWPVARSAAELLTSGEIRRVRECPAERCGWLFLDLTKNHSRRWCSMEGCGSRAKARRYYQRRKGGAGSGTIP